MLILVPATLAKTEATQSTEDLKKSWKINFSQPVDPTYATVQYVYILDGQEKIDVRHQVINGGNTIEITPVHAYESGKTYKLEVAGSVKSVAGKTLSEKTTMLFDVVDQSSAIQSIYSTSNNGLNYFRVTARPDVFTMKINGTALHMTGWNEFSYTFLNLKPGSKITIQAYNSSNRILETKTYQMD